MVSKKLCERSILKDTGPWSSRFLTMYDHSPFSRAIIVENKKHIIIVHGESETRDDQGRVSLFEDTPHMFKITIRCLSSFG